MGIPSYTEQLLQADGETVAGIDPSGSGSACTSGPPTPCTLVESHHTRDYKKHVNSGSLLALVSMVQTFPMGLTN